MAIKHKSRVAETASNLPDAATAFNLPTVAATGYQTFATAFANADQCPYFATNGTAWESGIGTFATGTPATLTRSLLESSTGSLIDFSGGSAVTLNVEWPAQFGQSASAIDTIPGGRLSISSTDPIGTAAASTSLYYIPFMHNVIPLWDGYRWGNTEFSTYTIALGTLTANICYDVFAYLSAGAMVLETLAWTSATARATAVDLQDGRYCKSGDKTRLLLGTFYAISTTQTQRDLSLLGIDNVYNKSPFSTFLSTGQNSHTYASTTWRNWNNTTVARINIVASIATSAFFYSLCACSSVTGRPGVSLNGATPKEEATPVASGSTIIVGNYTLASGLNYLQLTERLSTTATATFSWGQLMADALC